MPVLDWKRDGGVLLASFARIIKLSAAQNGQDPMWKALCEGDVVIVDEGQEMMRLPIARSIKRLGIKRRVVLTGIAPQDCLQVQYRFVDGLDRISMCVNVV